MSIKKTWFSYILWLIATGFSILFTYYAVSNLAVYWGMYGHKQIGFLAGYSAGVIVLAVLLCLLIRKLCDKIHFPNLNKWMARTGHILVFSGITAIFLFTRYHSFITGGLNGEQMFVFYEMSRIGFQPEEIETMKSVLGNVSLVPSVFESTYLKMVSMLFLFLGNKLELLDLLQLIFQTVSLLGLYIIGWNMQKGIWAWIPALLYAVSPIQASMIGNFGPTNFWLSVTVVAIVLCVALQKLWKKQFITYIVTSVCGIIVCIFVLGVKFGVLFQDAPAFFVKSGYREELVIIYSEFLIWAIILLVYCITFFFAKTDSASLYVMPMVWANGMLLVLQYYECDVAFFLTVFIGIWISFLGTEGLRILCTEKTDVITEPETDAVLENKENEKNSEPKTDNREDFDWAEMKTIMEQKDGSAQKEEPARTDSEQMIPEAVADTEQTDVSEDTGIIRVSDILKAVGTETGNAENAEGMTTEEFSSQESLDKTAMIENVLPMPKKHVSRSFEYSFEPSEDMMHYDVEIENDEYDYE